MKFNHFANFLLVALALLAGGVACSPNQQHKAAEPEEVYEVADMTDSIYNCVDSVIRTMTPEQKSAQCLIPAVFASSDAYTLQKIKEYARMGVGGLILLKGDARSASVIADSLNKWSEIPPFIAIDAEWGLAMRLDDAPYFPIAGRIRPEADEKIMFDYGAELADECSLLGINMLLGPVLDVADSHSYIGNRSLGTDKERVTNLGIAFAKGVESRNVISVAKHFPGHGAVKGDTHRHKEIISRSLQSLDSIDLYPFRNYIANGLSGIMVGHIAFPAIDPELMPSAVSKAVMTDLLCNDLGFKGLIVTDAMNMLGSEGKSAADAVEAGADIILAPKSTEDEIKNIMGRFYPDSLSITTENPLDSHVKKILFRKFLMGKAHNEVSGSDSLLIQKLNSTEARRIAKSLKQ